MPFFNGLTNQQFEFLNVLLGFLWFHFKLILFVKIIMCTKLLNFQIKKEKILSVILQNKNVIS